MPIKNLMKTIVIFYDEDSKYSKEKAFKGKSAVELTNEWAQSLNLPSFTVKSATLADLLCDMNRPVFRKQCLFKKLLYCASFHVPFYHNQTVAALI